jgi:hypothetical protein
MKDMTKINAGKKMISESESLNNTNPKTGQESRHNIMIAIFSFRIRILSVFFVAGVCMQVFKTDY